MSVIPRLLRSCKPNLFSLLITSSSMAILISRCQAVSRLDFRNSPPSAATMSGRWFGVTGTAVLRAHQILARKSVAACHAVRSLGYQRTMLSRLPLRRLVITPSVMALASVRVMTSIPRSRHMYASSMTIHR